MYRNQNSNFLNKLVSIYWWFYSLFLFLYNISVGILFEKNQFLIERIYCNYIGKNKTKFYVMYFIIIIYIPKIFFWDRFITRKSGIVDRMIFKYYNLTMPIEPKIPKRPFSDILKNIQPVNIAEPEFSGGNVTLYELFVISCIASKLGKKNRKVFEIGTFNGRTTLNIALNTSKLTKIYTLDLPRDKRDSSFADVCLLFDKDKYKEIQERIVTLYGDSMNYDFQSLNILYDMIFIDGDHSYDGCLNDSNKVSKILKEDGLIIWHDYLAWDGVTKYLNEQYEQGRELIHIEDTTIVVQIRKKSFIHWIN